MAWAACGGGGVTRREDRKARRAGRSEKPVKSVVSEGKSQMEDVAPKRTDVWFPARFKVALLLTAIVVGMPVTRCLEQNLRHYYRFGIAKVVRDDIRIVRQNQYWIHYSNGVSEKKTEGGIVYFYLTCLTWFLVTFAALAVESLFMKLLFGFGLFKNKAPPPMNADGASKR